MNDISQSISTVPQGWECPKCKSVYSPTTMKCWNCPAQSIGGVTTSNPTKK